MTTRSLPTKCLLQSAVTSITIGATTIWESWDSMLLDGSINPGKMTTFNHYAFGAIAKFMNERIARLQRLEAGWRKFRICPSMEAEFSSTSAHHVCPQGTISFSWEVQKLDGNQDEIRLEATIPPSTWGEGILREGKKEKIQQVGPG